MDQRWVECGDAADYDVDGTVREESHLCKSAKVRHPLGGCERVAAKVKLRK